MRRLQAPNCINPQCGRAKVYARGLCRTCYQQANFLIHSGESSWKEMEQLGLALPPLRSNTVLDELLDRRMKRHGSTKPLG